MSFCIVSLKSKVKVPSLAEVETKIREAMSNPTCSKRLFEIIKPRKKQKPSQNAVFQQKQP